MPSSTSSRESSPLSAASDEAPETSNTQYPPGSMMRPTRESRSRSARSPTTSTAPADIDSVLSSLSDDEAEADESGQAPVTTAGSRSASQLREEDGDSQNIPIDSQATTPDSQAITPEPAASGPRPASDAGSESDSGSLSPAPPSSELKPRPLPTGRGINNPGTEINETIQEESDESDLESLTDSNAGDKAEVDEQEEQEEEEAVELDGAREGRTHREVEEEDEDNEGDITMRADNPTSDHWLDAPEESHADKLEVDQPEGETVDESEAERAEAGGEEPIAQEDGEVELEDPEEAPDSPALTIQPFRPHSSHPPPPNSAAIKALFGLEIKFAALRDQLYVERMEETAAEEEMILNGTHPAVSYLFKNLKARRERLHEVASRKHKQVLHELAKVKDESKEHVWTWWTEERDREQWDEFEQTWAKRRRLIREKSELDGMPNKRQRPIPRTRADAPKPLDWAAGAIPAPMSSSEAASDLSMMDPRRNVSTHASPAVYQSYNAQSGPSYNPHAYRMNPTEELTYQQQQQPQQPQHHPQYAQRVPVPVPTTHHQIPPQTQHSAPIARSVPGQTVLGNPFPTTNTARMGRTVPTSSSLFDGGRRSNEGLASGPTPESQQQQRPLPQSQAQAQVPPLPQAPPPRSGMFGQDLWGNPYKNRDLGTGTFGLGLSNGTGHSNGNGDSSGQTNGTNTATSTYGPNNSHPQPQNGINTNTTLNTNTNPNTATTNEAPQKEVSTTTTASIPAPASTAGEKLSPVPTSNPQAASNRYPGLSTYLASTNVNAALSPQQSQSQKLGALSPPKSSLGISGVPTALPFV